MNKFSIEQQNYMVAKAAYDILTGDEDEAIFEPICEELTKAEDELIGWGMMHAMKLAKGKEKESLKYLLDRKDNYKVRYKLIDLTMKLIA